MVIFTALSAFNNACEFVEASAVRIRFLMPAPLAPCLPAYLRPPIASCRGLPGFFKNCSVVEMKAKCILTDDRNPLNFLGKHIFIKSVKSKHFGAYGFHRLFRNRLRGTEARSFIAFRAANPKVTEPIGTLSLPPSIAFSTDGALDFTCETGRMDASICEYAKFPAPFPLFLNGLIHFHRYDCFMRVFNKVLRKFSSIDFGFPRDGIGYVLLLEEEIPRIGNVAKDVPNG